MLVTEEVLKLDKSKLVKKLQFLNIPPKSITEEELKPDKSKPVKPEQLSNIPYMLVTEDIWNV